MNPDPNQAQPTPPPADTSLQFEKAEIVGDQPLTCASCKAPITSEYYQANGQIICPACRDQVSKFGTGGLGPVRFAKAVVAGVAAGIAGFVLYYAVLKLSGWNIGLIAIVVGWMVGTAVRWGSEARGGLLYQFLAAGVTYVASCATYAPFIYEELQKDGGGSIVKAIFAFIASMVTPWLEGPSNIIGWVILGFAVYQAWIMNRKVKIEVSGPFFTRATAPPAAT